MRRKLTLGVLLTGVALVAAACNVVVTPTAPAGWAFLSEGSNSSGLFINGPGNSPAGRGSALLTIDANGREAIASGGYSGLSLSLFDQMKYSTYQVGAGATGGAPNLEFDVDYDSKDSSTAYQGRLVYVPELSGMAVTPNTWQQWDTMTGTGAWYSSASGSSSFHPIVGDSPQAALCTQASFCTWAQIRSAYPNARIRPTVSGIPGAFLLRVGGNNHAGSAAVDNLIIGANGAAQNTNFEPGDGHIAINQSNAASLGLGFFHEGTTSGTGSFVSGPNGSDGSGSAQFALTHTTDGEALAGGIFAGTRFQDLTFLSYKTYLHETAGLNAPTLQMDADYDSTDMSTAFQGRVVFEPSLSQGATITAETWQTWNPLTATTGWFQTGTPIVANGPGSAVCTQAAPCSFQTLMSTYPNLAIRPITGQINGNPIGGGIWLKAGSGWTVPATLNVDSLTVGVKSGTTNGTVTYDFEG